ncbi:MAG: peptidylprolyl isomerase [Bacteroidaceae bacterium]|jgi:cyclophilin family peptidyl-prolyl cis-trans isomerase|nr:peptidylprolyl isomerase [Bacteroidaceae bacterium]
MKKIIAITLWACCLVCLGCTGQGGEKETEVVLETTVGEIRVKLYNDTPGHRDNFIKNVQEGYYTGVTFHRVIRNFMIQTGDPATRPEGWEAKVNADGDTITERIPAEILWPKHFNRRCMLAAARDPDEENPERMSDKYQFYIVTGKTCSDADMDGFETAREQRDAETLYIKKQLANKEKLDALRAARDRDGVSNLLEKLRDEARYEVSENPPITYPNELRKAYKMHGGAPWLDNEYTVFGEVIEGMKAVEAIQKLKTNANDVPLQEVRIVKAYVVE